MLSTWIGRSRLGWVAVATALYALAGVPLTAWLGPGVGPLSALPVAFAAALLGWRGGLAVALLCVPLITLCLNLAGVPGWDAMFRHGGGPGLVALLVVGLAVGWLRDLVARLRATEAALRASEARHRAVADTAFDAIVVAGADGCIQSFNRGAERIFGYAADEVVGRPLTILMPEHPRAAHEAGLARYLATGTPVVLGRTLELVGRREDGAEFPLEVTLTEGQEGGAAFFTGVMRDITARKADEATLRASETRFRLLAENAGDLIFRYRFLPAPGFEYVSPSATRLGGYTPEEHYADPHLLLKVIHPADRDRLLRALPRPGQVVDTPAARRDHPPFRWCRKDGGVFWGDARITLIRDQERRVIAMEGIVRDVTARMEAEEALRASGEKYRTLVEQAADGIVLTRLDGTIVEVNAAALALTGYDRGELLGRNAAEIVPPEDPAARPQRVEAVRAGQIVQSRRHLRRRDGTLGYVELSVRRLGEDLVQGIWRDITAQREAEAALRASEASLAEAQRLAHLGSWDYDLQTGALTWSDETYRIFGHAPRSFAPTYDGFLAQVHPDDRAVVERAVAATIGTGVEYDLEMRLLRPDGQIRAAHARGEAIAVAGQPARLVGVVLDITERQAAELALREEEQRSRELYAAAERHARDLELLDRVHTALARELDPAAVFRTIVESIASIFGHTRVSLYLLEGDELVRQQVAGQPSRLVRLPVSRGIMGRVARSGRPVLLEDVDSDPEFIRAVEGIVSEVCVPLFDAGRVVAGVLNLESTGGARLGEADLRLMVALSEQVGIALGRARLFAEARANADNLALAQRIAHLGSWEYDSARDQVRWSDEVFRILGYAPQSFIPSPKSILAVMHPDDEERVERAHRALVEDGTPYDLDYRILRPDGEIRIVYQQAENVQDMADGPIRRVGIMQDVTERRALEARLEHQAFHDPLTGLPNRALFLDRLGHALTRARRDGKAGAVLFLDLDRFKDVNDSLGHDTGDRLLVAVAARLRRCLRDEDTLARLGGDEFTVLLEDVTDPGEAARAAERLARALDAPIPIGEQEHRVTASVGIVLAGGAYERAEEVLRDADVAMYRAKEAGKARYAVFDPAMQTAVQDRLALEQDLRRALERGEFVLHYQPIVDLLTGHATRVEALVRWHHPLRGLVPPGTFLAVAEEAGLARTLGRWVLREACRQGRAWQEAGHPLPIAVNLTAQEFQGPGLVEEVAAALRGAGLDPQWLALEITEGAAMGDAPATVATLAALRALGVGVAIDDFGTGYSSLAYLQRFPVDALKVDKAFVDGLGTEAEDTAIVEAVVTLARTLGLGVVAEGVETAAQAARLAALGCGLGQGYLFARPLPPEEIPALLARRWPAEALLPALAD